MIGRTVRPRSRADSAWPEHPPHLRDNLLFLRARAPVASLPAP